MVDTVHLLRGVLSERGSVAEAVLEGLGVPVEDIYRYFPPITESIEAEMVTPVDYSTQASVVLRYARAEAADAGHHLVGTDHLLVGLIREGSGEAAHFLASKGIDIDTVRKEIARVLNRYTRNVEFLEPVVDVVVRETTELLRARGELARIRTERQRAIDANLVSEALRLRDEEKEAIRNIQGLLSD
jgi:ATP-dependent Clp protease ATP-binding subunit ClpC